MSSGGSIETARQQANARGVNQCHITDLILPLVKEFYCGRVKASQSVVSGSFACDGCRQK